MVHKKIRSFDIFSSHSHYLPHFGGMFALLGLLLAGALAGNIVTFILGTFCPASFVSSYGILISYPIQFIPPMLYAAAKSHSNENFFAEEGEDPGTPLDSNRFAPLGGFFLALMVSVGTIACAVVTEPVIAVLPDMPETIKSLMEMLTKGPLWSTLLSVSIFAPFFEEWLCRGMVLRGLLEKTSPVTAIAVSAAFFAVIHMNPWQAVPAFILGCLFGLVYYKTGSLKLTMLMHCVNNTFSVLMSKIPGMEEHDYLWQAFDDKWPYILIFAVSLSLLVLLVTRLVKTQFTLPLR